MLTLMVFIVCFTFSASILLVWWQKGHTACSNSES